MCMTQLRWIAGLLVVGAIGLLGPSACAEEWNWTSDETAQGTAPAPKAADSKVTIPPAPSVETKAPEPAQEKAKKPAPKVTPSPEPKTFTAPPEATPEREDLGDLDTQLASRGPVVQLASVPNMFGSAASYSLQVSDFSGTGTVDLPAPGGGQSSIMLTENDKAMPMDRVFFYYNYYHNAIEAFEMGTPIGAQSIDQYTIGFEKTFRDGLWSAEVRFPLWQIPSFTSSEFATDSGDIGNLAVILKRLLIQTDTTAVAAGLGIGTPTGSDTHGQGVASDYEIRNDAVHLSPFIGMLSMPNEHMFYQGFLQVDVATNDDPVVFGGQELGKLHEQTMLFVDLSLGYWLYRNPRGCPITGVAPVLEYHYASTLQDADIVTGTDGQQVLSYGNIYNRLDISNITLGLHTELGKTTVRVGGVFPLETGSNRYFDAEVQVSINRQF
jgi:hypothetical protein